MRKICTTIEQVGLSWRIREGRIDEYQRRHARMWPELEQRLRELGLVSCTIFRRDRECFGHFEVRGGWERHAEAYAADSLGQAWEREFADLIEASPGAAEDGTERLIYVWSLGD